MVANCDSKQKIYFHFEGSHISNKFVIHVMYSGPPRRILASQGPQYRVGIICPPWLSSFSHLEPSVAICLTSKKLNQIDFCFIVMCFKVFFDKFLKWIDKIWAHFYRSKISNLTYIKKY